MGGARLACCGARIAANDVSEWVDHEPNHSRIGDRVRQPGAHNNGLDGVIAQHRPRLGLSDRHDHPLHNHRAPADLVVHQTPRPAGHRLGDRPGHTPDNASTSHPEPCDGYVVDTLTRTPDTCRSGTQNNSAELPPPGASEVAPNGASACSESPQASRLLVQLGATAVVAKVVDGLGQSDVFEAVEYFGGRS